MARIAIIGGGSWGTALALALGRTRTPHARRLWVYEPDLAARMQQTRENDLYLPGFRLPPEVVITNDLAEALVEAEIVLSVMPSQFVRGLHRQMLPYLKPTMTFVSATKGLENPSLARMSQVIEETAGEKFPPRLAVLSGPTFAQEVASDKPAAVVVASRDLPLARALQTEFANPRFRFYTNSDVIGVELGGAVKNIIAIAAGVCDGLGLGANAIAALITRGLVEITRLACACGAQRETLSGLAGLGDLVLTCTGKLSRNRSLGVELARGRRLEEILASTHMVVEGVETTRSTRQLAEKLDVEMPITEQMYKMLFEGLAPLAAVRNLLERQLRQE